MFPKKKSKQALKNMNLTVNKGQIMTILGHNGCGKTTLINILTGILKSDEGQILVNNLDLQENIEDVRELIGVCPQFDLLWDYLTAWEHCQLFCKIRGVAKEDINQTIEDKLVAVDLWKLKNAQVKTFSGGMKRRLSLAISSIGDPHYIFLDEPTTGMDPKIRRYIWDLIKDMKKKSGIILTTHAMEEAEMLSDEIAVVVEGQLQCQGNSLYLKNNYGKGYKISMIVEPQDIDLALELVQKLVPDIHLERNQGGSLLFSTPLNNPKMIHRFFLVMENCVQDGTKENIRDIEKLISVVLDWGVSHATLEEVFLNITTNKLRHSEQF